MAELPLDQAIPRFKTNEDRIDRFTNGSSTQTYTTSDNVQVPTIRKFLADKSAEIDAGLGDIADAVTEAADSATAASVSETAAAGSASSAAGSATVASNHAVVAQGAAMPGISALTWLALNGLTGTYNGQLAEIPDTVSGTHTDPVTGLTVNDKGRYTWVSASSKWQRTGEAASSLTAENIPETNDPGDTFISDKAYIFANKTSGYVFGYLDTDGTWYSEKVTAKEVDITGQYKIGGVVLDLSFTETILDDILIAADSEGNVLYRVDKSGVFYAKIDISGNSELMASRGSRATIDARLNQSLSAYGTDKYRFGTERLRETKQRITARKFGENRQINIAAIGDSYTHNSTRWTGPAATYLISQYGDAGGGWLGFASNSGTLDNGNVRSSSYTYARSGTGWNYATYYTSNSPDIGQITSSTAADKITVTGVATPVLSAVNLYWIGTTNGVTRYRWNGGAWTTQNVQGTVGNLLSAALSTNMPASGAWTLEIEVVSGTCTLCGLDIQSAANGVRWHKLGSTGSTAAQWATASANAQWRSGLTSLAPNLIEVMLGTNDQGASATPATFAANIATIIDNCRTACPTADILVIMPPENQRVGNAYPMSQYTAAALEAVAARDAAFVDTQLLFGVSSADYAFGSARPWYAADLIHPDPATGGRVLANAFLEAIAS